MMSKPLDAAARASRKLDAAIGILRASHDGAERGVHGLPRNPAGSGGGLTYPSLVGGHGLPFPFPYTSNHPHFCFPEFRASPMG
jgi:hypothetical protein